MMRNGLDLYRETGSVEKEMPEIRWKGVIKSEEDFPAADIPEDAARLEGEEDIKRMQIKALPFMIPSVLICFLCMFMKAYTAGEMVIDVGFLFMGVIVGFLLIIVHELLHAVAFPKEATVYIGIMPKSFTAVALSASPVKRDRFVFLSLLPIILGIIPLIAFCLGGCDQKEWNGAMFGMAVMGMVSVYPDIYNCYRILKAVPKDAVLQNDKNTTYYYTI